MTLYDSKSVFSQISIYTKHAITIQQCYYLQVIPVHLDHRGLLAPLDHEETLGLQVNMLAFRHCYIYTTVTNVYIPLSRP